MTSTVFDSTPLYCVSCSDRLTRLTCTVSSIPTYFPFWSIKLYVSRLMFNSSTAYSLWNYWNMETKVDSFREMSIGPTSSWHSFRFLLPPSGSFCTCASSQFTVFTHINLYLPRARLWLFRCLSPTISLPPTLKKGLGTPQPGNAHLVSFWTRKSAGQSAGLKTELEGLTRIVQGAATVRNGVRKLYRTHQWFTRIYW